MTRFLLSIALLGGLGVGGTYAWRSFQERQEMIRLERENQELVSIIERLSAASRVAQATVAKRWVDDAGTTWSEVRFVEVDEEGKPLSESKTMVVEGDTVYFDALVLKFERDFVSEGDSTRGKSLVLFRRLFGEHQEPSEGFPLDDASEHGIPSVYRTAENPSQIEMELWEKFWNYANDPEAAERDGVRVAQGEAPYMKMEEGKLYGLSLDHGGGLNITVTQVPAVLLDQDG